MNRWMNVRMNEWKEEWMNGCMNGWMDGGVNEWKKEWMDG